LARSSSLCGFAPPNFSIRAFTRSASGFAAAPDPRPTEEKKETPDKTLAQWLTPSTVFLTHTSHPQKKTTKKVIHPTVISSNTTPPFHFVPHPRPPQTTPTPISEPSCKLGCFSFLFHQ